MPSLWGAIFAILVVLLQRYCLSAWLAWLTLCARSHCLARGLLCGLTLCFQITHSRLDVTESQSRRQIQQVRRHPTPPQGSHTLIASSASMLQCSFTGGSDKCFAMSLFLMLVAPSKCWPFTHSVATLLAAMALPQPNVLKQLSTMFPWSSTWVVSTQARVCERLHVSAPGPAVLAGRGQQGESNPGACVTGWVPPLRHASSLHARRATCSTQTSTP